MAQSLRAPYACQGHEAQDQDNVQGAVEAAGKFEVLAQPAEQAIGTQRGQARQQARHLNVSSGLEASRCALRQPHRRSDPLIGARAGCGDAAGRICVGAAALGLGAACGFVVGLDCAAAQDRYRIALHRLAQRRFIDAHNPGHFSGPLTFGQQLRAMRTRVRVHDPRLGQLRGAKE